MARNQIYIAHRRSCAPLAHLLRDRLVTALGDDVFFDASSLPATDRRAVALHRELAHATAALVVVDEGWRAAIDGSARREPVRDDLGIRTELAICLAARPGIAVVPVLIGDATLSDAEPTPGAILDRLGRLPSHRLRLGHLDDDLAPLVGRLAERLGRGRGGRSRTVPGRDRPSTTAGTALFDDPELERLFIEAARTDPDVFAELYRHYVPKIHAFVYRRSRSREVTEDITAATFEKALRQLERFEWKAGGFGPWLFRIASNELADHYRRVGRSRGDRGQKAMGALHTAFSVDDVEHVEGRDDDSRIVLAALANLNPRYQEAISLRYFAGLSHEDAAEAMGSSKPVMAVTLNRALKALKKEIEKLRGPEEP